MEDIPPLTTVFSSINGIRWFVKTPKFTLKKSLTVYEIGFTTQGVTKLQIKSLKVSSYTKGGGGLKTTF